MTGLYVGDDQMTDAAEARSADDPRQTVAEVLRPTRREAESE